MKQVYFLGKQSIGNPHIRKDMWRPLASIRFSSGYQGLHAYKQLNEYAKRHLAEWTYGSLNNLLQARGKAQLDPQNPAWPGFDKPGMAMHKRMRWWRRKVVGPALQDQKANSIADVAAVLLQQHQLSQVADEKIEKERALNDDALKQAQIKLEELLKRRKELLGKQDEASKKEYVEIKKRKIKIQSAMEKPAPYYALHGIYHVVNDNRIPAKKHRMSLNGLQRPDPTVPYKHAGPLAKDLRNRDRPPMSMKGIKIEWADILDREYAEEWPTSVEHGLLNMEGRDSRYHHLTKIGEPEEPEETPSAPKELVVEEVPKSRMRALIDRLRYGAQ